MSAGATTMNSCRSAIAVAAMLISFAATGQPEFKKLSEFKTSPVAAITLDRLGDIYLILKNDSIRKYDTEGKFMNGFADPQKETTTLLEPWNPLKIFRYVRGAQEIQLYDRFLDLQEKIPVDPAWAIEPQLVAPGTANNFWVLDKADGALSLVDPRTKGVVREAKLKLPPNAHPDFVWLREYQNLLFLIDRTSGVFIYNAVGTLVHKVEIGGIGYIGFLGEEFYYLDHGKLKFYDLYTEEVHDVSVDPEAKFVMVTDERMIVVKEKTVEIREFKEQ